MTPLERMLFYLVVCDIDGCRHTLEDDGPVNGLPTSEAQAVQDAAEAGWTWHGARTVCPCHWEWNGALSWA